MNVKRANNAKKEIAGWLGVNASPNIQQGLLLLTEHYGPAALGVVAEKSGIALGTLQAAQNGAELDNRAFQQLGRAVNVYTSELG